VETKALGRCSQEFGAGVAVPVSPSMVQDSLPQRFHMLYKKYRRWQFGFRIFASTPLVASIHLGKGSAQPFNTCYQNNVFRSETMVLLPALA
jgi:hypothetical protein